MIKKYRQAIKKKPTNNQLRINRCTVKEEVKWPGHNARSFGGGIKQQLLVE